MAGPGSKRGLVDESETDSDATTCGSDWVEEGVHMVLDTYDGDTSTTCPAGYNSRSRSLSLEPSPRCPVITPQKGPKSVLPPTNSIPISTSALELKSMKLQKPNLEDDVSDESDDIAACHHITLTKASQPHPPPTSDHTSTAEVPAPTKRNTRSKVKLTREKTSVTNKKRVSAPPSAGNRKRAQTYSRKKRVAKGLLFEDDVALSQEGAPSNDWTRTESSSSDDDDFIGEHLLRSRKVAPKCISKTKLERISPQATVHFDQQNTSQGVTQTHHCHKFPPSHFEHKQEGSLKYSSSSHQLVDELFGDDVTTSQPSKPLTTLRAPRLSDQDRDMLAGASGPASQYTVNAESFEREMKSTGSSLVASIDLGKESTEIADRAPTVSQSDNFVDIDHELFGF